jgi:ergothioneine biosynthesis protein EgtB
LNISDYCTVRTTTEALAAPLSPEDQTVQSMPDVSPTKWHRAHTTWFFETFVLPGAAPGYEVFDDSYGYLFNSYYEAVGPRHARPERGLLTRPGVDEVARYRTYVDGAVTEALDHGLEPATMALLELGLHHEQQHQELVLMDIKHVLSRNPTHPVYGPLPWASPRTTATTGVPAVAGDWLDHDGGIVEVGFGGGGFAFDNEGPRHDALLRPFALAPSLVTNADWLAFIDDGGYRRPELWMSDGWSAVQANGWYAPEYWQHDDDAWQVFTLDGLVAVDAGSPVNHVSWYEADAFARWAGARLPWEAEWEVSAPPAPPVLAGTANHGTGDGWYGAAWQWTTSSYGAYPGFKPAAGAVGEYNGKFMCNQFVLRGSCVATPPGHARRTYRNFFPPHARWAFTGVRLARDPG